MNNPKFRSPKEIKKDIDKISKAFSSAYAKLYKKYEAKRFVLDLEYGRSVGYEDYLKLKKLYESGHKDNE